MPSRPEPRRVVFGIRSLHRILATCVVVAGLAGAARAQVVVSTATTGPLYGDGSTFTVTAAGSITGGTQGVIAQSPTNDITTLSNSGTIEGSNGIENYGSITTLTNDGRVNGLGDWGIYTAAGGSLGALTNSGTIGAGQYGYGLYGTSTSLTNQAGGLIEGSNYALYLSGTLGTVSNAGTISSINRGLINFSTLDAVDNTGLISNAYDWNFLNYGTLGTITNSGTIQSAVNTFGLFSTTGTLTNQAGGLIQATDGYALYVDVSGTIGSVANGGTIASVNNRTIYNATGIGTFTNSGLVSAGALADYTFLSYGALDTLTNSGTFQGAGTVFGLFAVTGTLANQAGGLIQATNGYAVYIDSPGSLTALSNAGTIESANNRTIYNATGIGTFTNSGLVSTGADYTFLSYGALGTLTNSGTFQGPTNVVSIFAVTGTLANQAGGLISGTNGYALYIHPAGSIDSVTNAGTISSTTYRAVGNEGTIGSFDNSGLVSTGGEWAFISQGSLGTLTNSGTIQGPTHALGLYAVTGTVANQAGGSISGDSGYGVYLSNTGSASLLDNAGSITSASARAVLNQGTVTSLTNSGRIIGYGDGVASEGTIASIVNTGTMSGGESAGGAGLRLYGATTTDSVTNSGVIDGRWGVWQNNSTITTLTNSGTLSGVGYDADGIYINTGTIGSLVNQATGWIGGNNMAIQTESGGAIGSIDNAGTIFGWFGIRSVGGLGTFVNRSTGYVGGNGYEALATGQPLSSFLNEAGGVIEALSDTGVLFGSAVTTATNAGTITGYSGGNGVQVGGAMGTLTNTGTISAGNGIYNGSAITLLDNGAVVRGTASWGLYSSGSIGTFVNSGTIRGVTRGVMNDYGATLTSGTNAGWIVANIGLTNNGTIGSFANAGVVSGTTSFGISSNGALGTLTNSGTIQGSADGVAAFGSITTLENLAGGRIAATGDSAINVRGSIGTLTNAGTLAGSSRYGINLDNGGGITTLTNTGLVTSSNGGIYNDASAAGIGTLTNSGTISGSAFAIRNDGVLSTVANTGLLEGDRALVNVGYVFSLDNSGLMRGNGSNQAIYLNGSATIVTLTNSGTITSGPSGNGIDSAGTINGLTNTGVISGVSGVTSTGVVGAVDNSGTIVGSTNFGLFSSDTLGTLTNSGTVQGLDTGLFLATTGTVSNLAGARIEGTTGDAVFIAGPVTSLANAGVITGSTAGVIVQGGALGQLANTGTIAYTGTGTGPAVKIGTGGVLGDATGASGPALTSTGSGALLAGTIENQGTVHYGFTVDNQNVTVSAGGGAGTFSSGTLTVTNGNLTFTDGQTTLGADISVNGGSGTFTNEATLRLLGIENVTGNFQQNAGGTVLMELLGTGSGQYGQMNVSGAASFAGGLDLGDTGLTGGLAAGQLFQLFGFGSYSGGFSGLKVNGTSLASAGANMWTYGSLLLTEQWTGTTMSLAVSASGVPEIDPASAGSVLSLVVGALAMAERRLRRGRRGALTPARAPGGRRES